MSELLVYKASAGSGKTFTLAVEYIKLLILNPRASRQILAVTFTNKATAEMKERIPVSYTHLADIVPVSSLPGIPFGFVVKYLSNSRCVSFCVRHSSPLKYENK